MIKLEQEVIVRHAVLDRELDLSTGFESTAAGRRLFFASKKGDARELRAIEQQSKGPQALMFVSATSPSAPFTAYSGSTNGFVATNDLNVLCSGPSGVGYAAEARLWADKTNTGSAARTIIQARNPSSAAHGRWWLGLSGSSMELAISRAPQLGLLTGTGFSLEPRSWHTVSMVTNAGDGCTVYVDGAEIFSSSSFMQNSTSDNFRLRFGATELLEVAAVDPLDGIMHACRAWNGSLWSASGSSFIRQRVNDMHAALPSWDGGWAAGDMTEYSGILLTGASTFGPAGNLHRHRIYANSDIETAGTNWTFAKYLEPIDMTAWRRIGACDPTFTSPQSSLHFLEQTYQEHLMLMRTMQQIRLEGMQLDGLIDPGASTRWAITPHDGLLQLRLPGAAGGRSVNVGSLREAHGLIMLHPSMADAAWGSQVRLQLSWVDCYTQVWLSQHVPQHLTGTQACELYEVDGLGLSQANISGVWAILSGTQPSLSVRIPVEVF